MTWKFFPVHKGDKIVNSALYSSATAMKAFSTGLGVIGNNLANVSTVGYKQQNLQYADLIYASQGNMGAYNNSEEGSLTSMGQVGLGVQVGSVRTLFHEGGYEITNSVTDLAIAGKGFFQVVDDIGNAFYTKAGNFHINNEGILKTPGNLSLSGYAVDENGNVGGALGPILIDPLATMPPKATTSTQFILNLGIENNNTNDDTDPYFSLAKKWDARNSGPPLSKSSYGYTESVRAYDEKGKGHDVNVYFDVASDDGQHKIVEFVVGTSPSDPETDNKDGLLMMGTLTFDASGKLVDMTAFVPTGADKNDLTSWTKAPLKDGLPQYTLKGEAITLDLGMKSEGDWGNMPESAADVGTDPTKLGTINPAKSEEQSTTSYGKSPSTHTRIQNGYAEGHASNMEINAHGEVIISYTNNQSQTLYQIPIARFVSEDGLHREGGNLFSAPEAAGLMELGMPGSENYGGIYSHHLETSNVNMSREMVNMIITQRSFQSCSKALTTADAMLQKAIELKR